MMKHLEKTAAVLLCCGTLLQHCADSVEKTVTSRSESGVRYSVDALRCKSCGACFEVCPERAVIETSVDGQWIYIIDPDRCVGCGICGNACIYGAISPGTPAY